MIEDQNDERPDNLEDGRTAEPQVVAQKSDEPTAEVTEQSLREELANAEAEVQLAIREFESAKAVLAKARGVRDEIRQRAEKWRRKQPANANVVGYLATQQRVRQERAEKMRKIREAGIDLRALEKSPLDAAIAQRKRVEGAPSHTPKPAPLKKAGSDR